jgi:hypothetical protein
LLDDLVDRWNVQLTMGIRNGPFEVRARLLSASKIRIIFLPSTTASGSAFNYRKAVLIPVLEFLALEPRVHWLSAATSRGRVLPRNAAAKQLTQASGALFGYTPPKGTERDWRRFPAHPSLAAGLVGGCKGTRLGCCGDGLTPRREANSEAGCPHSRT